MHIVDTHTHIYLDQFKEDTETIIQRAQQQGVTQFCLPNIDTDSIPQIDQLCRHYPEQMFPMWGLHPCSVTEHWEKDWEIIRQRHQEKPGIAIGEIGLDLYWDTSTLEWQKAAFVAQCTFAAQENLPIAIHVRNAFTELFEVMDTLTHLNLRGVFHCFTGGKEVLEKALSYPCFLFGIGGVVTFKNGGLDKVLPHIPLEKIVVETDAPYLAPVPYRGKRNEPVYLVHILEKMSAILDVPESELRDITTANAQQLFNLPKL